MVDHNLGNINWPLWVYQKVTQSWVGREARLNQRRVEEKGKYDQITLYETLEELTFKNE